ncbi:MAG TPA: hypothetical protein VF553_17105 [Pyrinomonadaceae bacterium]|jgi:hypothetical protein
MAEEKAQSATENETPAEIKVEVLKRGIKRNTLWWAILAVYLVLFISTGCLAFIVRDVNPVLKQGFNGLSQQPDETTKTFIINLLQDEAEEHKKKDGLVLQSFNIVLGSLLGFLSASAVSRGSEKDDS